MKRLWKAAWQVWQQTSRLFLIFMATAASASDGKRFYSYAATGIRVGGATYIFSCENERAGVVADSIYVRRMVGDTFLGRQRALAPSFGSGKHDSFHVCDPQVVKGQFLLGERSYSWAMFYTANDHDSAFGNSIGIAFADAITGPWTRSRIPLVDFNGRRQFGDVWGVGQPSVVNMDGMGLLRLYFTRGGRNLTDGALREIRLDDKWQTIVENLDGERGAALSNRGLGKNGGSGGRDYLNNFDIAMDDVTNSLIVARPMRPQPRNWPTNISEQIAISSARLESNGMPLEWRDIAIIDREVTGSSRNHNAGIIRLSDGRLPQGPYLEILVTTADACNDPRPCGGRPLWSYRPVLVRVLRSGSNVRPSMAVRLKLNDWR